MLTQLPLDLHLRDEASFENFVVGSNEELINNLKQILSNPEFPFIYIWGRDVGRTHLLQACCKMATQLNHTSIFLSLKNFSEFSVQIFEGMEDIFLVCIDDVDLIVQKSDWEEALFHFYNRSREKNARLIISGSCPPSQLHFSLADLSSRLTMALCYQIKPLDDVQKLIALKNRAKQKGITISEEVGNYLLTHCPRGMVSLFNMLEYLDTISLANKRKITIPFLKEILNPQ